jgi:hypothetical protein
MWRSELHVPLGLQNLTGSGLARQIRATEWSAFTR